MQTLAKTLSKLSIRELPRELIRMVLIHAVNLDSLLYVCKQWLEIVSLNLRAFERHVVKCDAIYLPSMWYPMLTLEQKISLSNHFILSCGKSVIREKFLVPWDDIIACMATNTRRALAIIEPEYQNLRSPLTYFTYVYTHFEQFRRYVSTIVSAEIIASANDSYQGIRYLPTRYHHVAYDVWSYIERVHLDLEQRIMAEYLDVLKACRAGRQ
jgi:hypothetical protein